MAPAGEVHNGVLVPGTSPPREGAGRGLGCGYPGGWPHGGPELALEPGGILCGRAETPPNPARPGPSAGRLHFAASSARRSAASRSDWAVVARVALKPYVRNTRTLITLKKTQPGPVGPPRPAGYPRGLRGPEKLMTHVELQDLLNCC